jgi:cell division septation protein DedD
MVKRLKVFSFLLLLSYSTIAQNDTIPADSASKETNAPVEPKSKTGFVFKPTLGIGTGMFSFYGDLYAKNFQNPSVSRIAYDLIVSQRFTEYLQFNFYVLFGQLGANERMIAGSRNLNFNSHIRAGGVNLLYNFGNFLPKDRWASPYITLGIESFEFLSKTDLSDSEGNIYNYWSDGTIRNLPENDPNAENAIEIQRDYTYESDIRSLNLDGFGKYAERSWAVPVGAGAMMKINEYWTFRIGATMHFTFTDYIDGVTAKSAGNRTGNSRNDNFMMSSISIHYNLGTKKKSLDTLDEDHFNDVDFFALDMEDFDKDGIPDTKDSCQGTPAGTPVDAFGCPLDDDGDGVPNNQDDEPSTPKGVLVDTRGVTLNDSTIAYQYSFYTDSTGLFAKVEYHDHNGNIYSNPALQKEYTVDLGTFKKGLPPELMTKFLSINDISSSAIDDSTTLYTAGKFPDLLSAEKRKQELVSQGLTNAKVIYKQNGKYYDAPKYGSGANNNVAVNTNNGSNNNPDTNNNPGNNNSTNNTNNTNTNNTNNTNTTNSANPNTNNSNTSPTDNISQSGIVLRVQLGAYKNRLSKKVFRDINDLIEIKTEDGLYKYLTGSYTNFDAAAKHKVEMLLKGYNGAFIAAYKDGKRISLAEAGATMPKKGETPEVSDSSAVNGANKNLVIFKVQVGAFKNEPPSDKQEQFNKIKGISKEITSAGLNRYVVGSFPDYKSAEALKAELIKNGLADAFVIASFNGEYITIQEAIELSK